MVGLQRFHEVTVYCPPQSAEAVQQVLRDVGEHPGQMGRYTQVIYCGRGGRIGYLPLQGSHAKVGEAAKYELDAQVEVRPWIRPGHLGIVEDAVVPAIAALNYYEHPVITVTSQPVLVFVPDKPAAS